MNPFVMLICSSHGHLWRQMNYLSSLHGPKLSVETPSLEASSHLPRHGRVSSDSGSCHVWEQRHGSTTQPPERGILRAHMHTHNNLRTHTQLTDTVRYRHINTATQLSAQRWLASSAHRQGLGWCCVDTVTFIQLQSSPLRHREQSWAGPMG